MSDLVTLVATACFAFASGIFLTLSYVEKPVWALMRNPVASSVDDDVARQVHAELRRVIHLLPPTMMTTMGLGATLLVVQAWQSGWNWPATGILGFFLVCMAYLLSQLFGRIEAVAGTGSDGDIGGVRSGVGRLAAIHHFGLFVAAGVLALQVMLVAFAM